MTKTAIKIVRPWPAEQPRPPLTYGSHRIESAKGAVADRDVRGRPPGTKAA
jgi:hypothetical protein